jgi:hypothetical protein
MEALLSNANGMLQYRLYVRVGATVQHDYSRRDETKA